MNSAFARAAAIAGTAAMAMSVSTLALAAPTPSTTTPATSSAQPTTSTKPTSKPEATAPAASPSAKPTATTEPSTPAPSSTPSAAADPIPSASPEAKTPAATPQAQAPEQTATPQPQQAAATPRLTVLEDMILHMPDGRTVALKPFTEESKEFNVGYLVDSAGHRIPAKWDPSGAGFVVPTDLLRDGQVYTFVVTNDGEGLWGEIRQTFRMSGGRVLGMDQGWYERGARFNVSVDAPVKLSDPVGLNFIGLSPNQKVNLAIVDPVTKKHLGDFETYADANGNLVYRINATQGWVPGQVYGLMFGVPDSEYFWYTEFMLNADGSLTPIGPSRPVGPRPDGHSTKGGTSVAGVGDSSHHLHAGLPHTGV